MNKQKPIIIALITLLLLVSIQTAYAQSSQFETHWPTPDEFDISMAFQGVEWSAQTFTCESNHTVAAVKIPLCRYEDLTVGTITLSIRVVDGEYKPTGGDLTSGTVNGDSLPIYVDYSSFANVTFTVTPYNLTEDVMYAIVVRAPDSATLMEWGATQYEQYTFGNGCYSGNSGSTWSFLSGIDGRFIIYGTPILPPEEPPTQYQIVSSHGAGGTISPLGTVYVNESGSQAYTITAANGYAIQNVTVDGASVGAVTLYTFSNVTANHTITAYFVAEGSIYSLMWAALYAGDIILFFRLPLEWTFGNWAYFLLLLGVCGAFYIRYRNLAVILALFVLFGGAGGLVGWMVPAPANAAVWLLLVLGLAGLLWRVTR